MLNKPERRANRGFGRESISAMRAARGLHLE
jgi:hypothetical protein